MPYFTYQSIFPLGADTSEYRLLTRDYVDSGRLNGYTLLKVSPEGLRLLAQAAFTDVAHLYRSSHLAQLQRIHDDPESSDNDRFVSLELLKNAVISAEGIFPMCQDTGTALIMGKKGQQVWTGGGDEAALSEGVFDAYTQNNLRYSQNAPISMFDEINTGCNLPAQIDIQAVDGEAYGFLFIAKGGGSANKTFLYQENKTILKPETLQAFIKEKLKTLGTAACPPYHLALVVGGLSAEMTLKTVKLASAGYLDGLPVRGNENGHAFRDPEIEKQVLQMAMETGIGAQFGGKYFCHDVRVIRLPRHGASCPIGLGVSCSADRNIKAKITREGIFLEKLETDPARFLPAKATPWETGAVPIDLNRSMDAIRAELSNHPVGTRLLLNGPITVARDIAHARLKDLLDSGKDLPRYVKDHIMYCAGPAKTPPGHASGSFGPTTASRMDTYVPLFQENGASLVMLAKGNRSRLVTDACRKNGGFYLGAVGGPAARIGKACITQMETLAYPELGMEAIFRITVKNFPALILVDDKGNDFFSGLLP